jgi:glycosyltransferase involved in cell wall biosynthesis
MNDKNKIKICHIAKNITGKEDGVFKHLLSQINLLDNDRFEHILIFPGGDVIENILDNFNVKYYVIPELNEKLSIRLFRKIYRILKQESIDIINTHSLKSYILGGLINVLLRKKIVYSYHGHFIRNEYNSIFEQKIYYILHLIVTLFNRVYALTPSMRSKELLKAETKRFSKIDFYYHGNVEVNHPKELNNDLIQKLSELRKQFLLIGYIGRLDREKNAKLAIKLFSEVKKYRGNIFLLIFGSGEEEDEIKNFVLENELKNISFLGYIKNAESYKKYLDIIILTSNSEGMPMVLWEAMKNGVPFFSTNVGGIPEIVENEKCGFVFDQNDFEDGLKKLLKLIDDENLRRKFGENGRKALLTKYTSDNFKYFFENYYTELVNEK